jgi:phosphate transport system substrate-binding protein
MAYEKIVDKTADIIFVAAPSQAQQDYAKEQGVGLVYTPFGREAFVFFVNAQNPLENITVEQIRNIYSGQTTQWSQLGINNLGKIKAFQRDEGSGSQSALVRLMGETPLADPPKENVVAGMGGIISKTADYKNHKNAIGYSFRFYCTEMVQNNQIKLLNVNGVAPTVENIEDGTYPIAAQFYAVTRSDADANTQLLLEWIQGSQGQQLIEQTGYTPLN